MSIEKQIKQINIATYLLIVIAFIGVFLMPKAFAIFGIFEDNSNQVAWAEQIMSGPLDVVVGTIAGTDPELGGLWAKCISPLEGNLATAFNTLKVLGGLMALAVAMAHILDRLQKEADTQEAITRGLMEFFVAAFIIMNVADLMDAIGNAGTAIAGYFTGGGNANITGVDPEALLTALTGDPSGGVTWRMEANVYLLLPWMLSMIIVVATKFAVIQIVLEIIVRKIFAPMAVADIYHEGLRSPGMRYLKRYLGAYLKMAVCAAVCVIIPTLMTVSPNTGGGAKAAFNYMFSIVAINFAAVAMMFKAGEITNDVMGA